MLLVIAALLLAAVVFLLLRLHWIGRDLEEIRRQIGERMETETNIGIDTASYDPKIRALAADLDRQLKLLRQKQILYTRGDQELKTAVTHISHDLRTPLTAVYGYLSLLEGEEMSEAAAQYVAILKNRADVLKALSEEMFRYSVILSVDVSVQKEEVSVNAVLEESLAGYYGAIQKAGLTPKIRICEQTVVRNLNRQALSRIFSNIIGNALKYSDGDLQVSMDAAGRICFSNQAHRLDPVSVGHLFDRFYTVESGRSSTGLGLSIARTLAEGMGGTIDAEYEDGVLRICVFFEKDA
ncbi:MAG: HAMP domain-containing histidine kinase [Eubacterium sp.]|nr:HAMP domain-containing histidine kinase [Eubacterium sp.]